MVWSCFPGAFQARTTVFLYTAVQYGTVLYCTSIGFLFWIATHCHAALITCCSTLLQYSTVHYTTLLAFGIFKVEGEGYQAAAAIIDRPVK